jgi:type IX secretion system substrate protein
MLPDSNGNEPGSHGFIKYKVKPDNTLQVGAVMNNTAYIYFDFNSPVQTNTTSTIILPVGIQSFGSSNEVYSIFPNPAHEYLTIRFRNTEPQGQSSVSVLDVAGRVILSQRANTGSDILLNLNSISRGIYFLQLKFNDRIYQNKFVKN